MSKSRLTAYLALLGNTIIWGLALPIVKKGLSQGLSPTNFLLGRYLLASLFSLPVITYLYLKNSQIKIQLRLPHISKIVLLELLGTFIALLLLYQGLSLTSAVDASLIAITWPILVILGGVLFLKEKEQKHEVLGLILALMGTTALIAEPLIKNHGFSGTLTGNLLVLGQNLCIAAYYLLAKKYYRGLNKWLVTHISFWVGSISFTLYALFTHQAIALPTVGWPLISVIYMGILGSIVALTLYLIGQDKIEASEASLFTYLQPVFSLPAAVILLSESISFLNIFSLILILSGVYLAEKRQS